MLPEVSSHLSESYSTKIQAKLWYCECYTLLLIDLFSLSGLLPHFRPCDITLENSCFQISNSHLYINEYFLDG